MTLHAKIASKVKHESIVETDRFTDQIQNMVPYFNTNANQHEQGAMGATGVSP